jgi:hypothetical protein
MAEGQKIKAIVNSLTVNMTLTIKNITQKK